MGPYTKAIGLSENFYKFSPNALKLLKPTSTFLAPRCIFYLPPLYYSLFFAFLNITRIKRYTLQRLSTIDIITKIVFRQPVKAKPLMVKWANIGYSRILNKSERNKFEK